MPGAPITYPLEVYVPPASLSYAWVPAADSGPVGRARIDAARRLGGPAMVAPAAAGFYRLALYADGVGHVVEGPILAVMVPFSAKLGSTLNGYRIGTYLAERFGGATRPRGFIEIEPHALDLHLTTHLRLADFVAHDGQETWPRYVALDGRLLDKIELVVGAIAQLRGGAGPRVSVSVHSGFRTPLYNRRVDRAARDSRHQYGDAVDITIDADGDGRITARDMRLVAAAVEEVEREHPDLVGGMGLYNRGGASYVHIDARGRRARWRG